MSGARTSFFLSSGSSTVTPPAEKYAPGISSICSNILSSFTITVPPTATAGEKREAYCSS